MRAMAVRVKYMAMFKCGHNLNIALQSKVPVTDRMIYGIVHDLSDTPQATTDPIEILGAKVINVRIRFVVK